MPFPLVAVGRRRALHAEAVDQPVLGRKHAILRIELGETRGLGWLYVTDPSANRIVAVPVTRPAGNVARARQTPAAQPRRRLPG